jgi:hypothetical protein
MRNELITKRWKSRISDDPAPSSIRIAPRPLSSGFFF